jgi:hypothetical protein
VAIAPAMTPAPPLMNGGGPPLDVQITPDGAPPMDQMPPDAMDQGGGHRDNLVDYLDEEDLQKIASELIELVDNDDRTRAEWISSYTSGLDYLGFKGEERTAPFKGSCGVYHPILTESVVRFQSNAIMEIFPAAGPALTKIVGDDTTEKVALSKRVKEELNWQLTENMREYRNETEQLLFRLPLAGSVFRKVYYDPIKKRPSACMVPAEDFIVDYGCSDLENSERYTHVVKKSVNQVKRLQKAGFYAQMKLPKPANDTPPEGREKEDEITGVEKSGVQDDRYKIYEVHTYYNLPGILEDPDGIADPYIIHIETQSQKVLAVYRNWREDETDYRCAEQYFVHYQYLPGLGFYGIGLIHLIGSIAKAATSILRQLVDAGTLSNLPGGLKTRGLRTKGDDTPIAPGEWRDVDVPAGTIQQNLFPMPYKEPSPVLAQLLSSLVDEGRRVGSIADLEVTSQTMNAPVGTTLALLERSLKVMSAVHARLHASLRREFGLIGKVISDYMDEHYLWDETGQFNRRQDFDSRTVDVLPVSDPNAATQAQKIIQMQAVQQQAQTNPELYNMKELHRAGLQAIGVKNDERILPLDQPPPRLDPVSENMALLTGQPTKVFPDQDHTAHIQVHLSMATDPKILEMLKASPNAAKVQGAMEAHLSEHLANQYHDEMQQMMGVQLPPIGEQQPPEVEAMLARALADASVRLRELHQQEAQQKVAEQVAADPVYALREREVALKERIQEHKEKVDAVDRVMDVAKEGKDEQLEYAQLRSKEAQAGAKIAADLYTFGSKLENDQRMESINLGTKVTENIHKDAREMQKMVESSNQKIRDTAIERSDRQAKRQEDRADRLHESHVKRTDAAHQHILDMAQRERELQNENEQRAKDRAHKERLARARPKPNGGSGSR